MSNRLLLAQVFFALHVLCRENECRWAALRQATGGQLDMATGTVYPALRRLERAGLITGSWSVVTGLRRREYRLTAALAIPSAALPVILAVAAGAARLTFTAWNLRPVMTG